MQSTNMTNADPIWRDKRAIALLMAASLTTMANATISPALPGLERLFAGDPNAAMLTRLLVPAPSLSVALCAPFVGLAADRIGRRPLLLSGIVLFVISGCAGLYLPDLPTIFLSRIVLGVAVALIMTAQTALVGDYFTGSQRNALTGLQISARNFGGLVCILLAGWVAAIAPRLPFAIYGLAAAFLPLMWRVLLDSPRAAHTSGGPADGNPASNASWLAPVALLGLLQAATNLIFFIMPTQLSFFLEAGGRDSAVMTGTGLGVLMLSGGCVALLYPRIQRATGYAGIFALGYGAMALGFLLLTLVTSTTLLLPAAVAIGTGYALVSPTFVALALGLTPSRSRGLGGGILTTSIFIGQFCSPFVSMPMIAGHGYAGLFRGAGTVLAILAVAAMSAAVLSRPRR